MNISQTWKKWAQTPKDLTKQLELEMPSAIQNNKR